MWQKNTTSICRNFFQPLKKQFNDPSFRIRSESLRIPLFTWEAPGSRAKTDTVQKLKICLTSFAESVSKKWAGIEID
jgi:glucan phosphoethanolaminetransferase (alkaline phosphatase superfamily)